MVLDKLGDSLKNTLSKIAKSVFVDEKLINELVKDIQRALLQSDVNVKLVFELSKNIKERALKDELPPGLSKKEHLVTVVHEELIKFLGGEEYKIDLEKKPLKLMLVGLFGAGKTTTAGKLAKYYSTRGKKVALVGLDVHRPAAKKQIMQLGEQLGVKVFTTMDENNPVTIYNTYKEELENNFDIIILDTAGRDALNDELIAEIEEVNKVIAPDERFLVIQADIGQAAERQAKQFHESCDITGVMITKMDGTAKGGGALSACSITKAPIVFIGVGEKAEDLEPFNPTGFVGRLLGMGDIEVLLDKAKAAMSEQDAEDMSKKFTSGEFNLRDLYDQMKAMRKMGPLAKVMELVPGMGQLKLPKELLNAQEGKLDKWKYAMDSMTPQELEEPDCINPSRLERVSGGSGVGMKDIREMLKQYKQSKKVMKMFKGKDPEKMMKKMGGMKGIGNMMGKGGMKGFM